jgi:hypothetical protein
MYDTHPKFSLALVTALLVAAFVLPMAWVIPGLGETAAGFHIAIMLLVLFIIRMTLMPSPSSWRDAARFPLLLIAAVTELGFLPPNGVMDIIARSGFVAILVGIGAGFALIGMARRPKTLGFAMNRQFWITLGTLAILIAVNHLYRFPNAQAAALVANLVLIAVAAHVVPIGW